MACETDFRTWHSINVGSGGSSSPFNNGNLRQNVASLEADRYVMAYRDGTVLKAKVLDLTGGTLAEGTPQTLPGTLSETILPVVVALDTTTFVIQHRDGAVVGTIDISDNITFGALLDVWGEYPTGTSRRAVSATALTSTSFVTFAKIVADAGNTPPYKVNFRRCTISGTTITPQADFPITDFVPITSTQATFGLPGFGGGTWVLGFANSYYDGASQLEGAHIVVGDEDTFDIQLIGAANRSSLFVKVERLDANTAVAFYDEADDPFDNYAMYMRVFTFSGDTITSVGPAQQIAANTVNESFTSGVEFFGVADSSMAAVDDNKIIVSAPITVYTEEGSESCTRIFYLSRDTNTITEVVYCDVIWHNVEISLYAGGNNVFSFGNNEVTQFDYQELLNCLPESQSILILGVSVVGNTAFVTAWAGETLVLNIVDLSLGEQIDSIVFGPATLSEVLAKTYVAYPCALSNNQVYIFGRINTGAEINHILYSEDAGSNFEIIENNWGLDYAGAMICRSVNNFYVMRCNSYSSKLYEYNNGELVVRSTLPFTGPVEPHGLRFSDWDETILAAVDLNGQVQTVVYAVPPHYLNWNDITFNHPQTAVNAIAPL